MIKARLARWSALVMSGIMVAALGGGIQAAAAPPAAASADIQIYFADTVRDSVSYKIATAECQLPGQKVLGGGGRLFSDATGVALQTMYPFTSSTGDGYAASAAERADGYSGTWKVRSYVVCGNRPAGWELRFSGSTFLPTGARTKRAVVRCSAGKVVIGTGGVVGDVSRGVSFNGVIPTREEVYVDGLEDPNDGFGVPDFGVGAWAICANEPAGYQVVTESVQRSDSHGIGKGAPCPPGKEVTGVGMDKGGDNGVAHTYSVHPHRSSASGTYSGAVNTQLWDNTKERTWWVRAWAICVS